MPAAACSYGKYYFSLCREAFEGPFPSDHEDPRYRHRRLVGHSSRSSHHFHPGPDEAAEEKGNSAKVLMSNVAPVVLMDHRPECCFGSFDFVRL